MAMRADVEQGTLIGRYRVERLIGRGGMSSVYVARDLELDRDVALKVIAPELADDNRFVERFRQESRLAAVLEHNAVVPVYDAGEADGAFYIAMRLIRGRDLRVLLRDEGPVEVADALALLGPVADALDAAHALGLVHRDVKPGNILVGEDGRAHLADFGLTKPTSASTAGSGAGQLVGTVDYVSPEQIRGEPVDGRADQYSLACVLYECVTGRTPFARDSELGTLWAHVEEICPLASAIRPGLSPAFDEAVALALSKVTSARFASCREFLVRAGTAGEALPRPAGSPFPGLAPFGAADAPYFFGRERLVAQLLSRLDHGGLLALVGASGSGKSSLLQAGLLPSLAHRHAVRVVLRPGARPSSALDAALGGSLDELLERSGSDKRLVIAVDQFEEVFTACEDGAERGRFVAALVHAAASGRCAVVLAMRADYFGDCAAYPALAELLGASTALVGPLAPDELARTVEGPAVRAGLTVEPGLTEELVNEVAGAPGGLPLLSTALRELWSHRDGGTLTLRAYRETGGVRGAVARLAEETYAKLRPDEQDAARGLLLRLAGSGERGEAVRRRVPLAELDADRNEALQNALSALTSGRLVTADEDAVEVAHEALFREWPRLRVWLEADTEARAVRRRVSDAAAAWEAGGRDPSDLLRGARLAAALEWEAGHPAELNERERRYLDAGRAVAEAEALRERRANRRLRTLLALAGVLLLVTAVAFVVALGERSSANDAATRSEVQRLGTLSRTQRELDRSILLGRQATELSDSAEARGTLLAALTRAPAAIRVIRPGLGRLQGIAAASTGGRIVVWDDDHVGKLVDARSGRVLARRALSRARFTPDGRTAILVGERVLTYLDARTGRTVRTWSWPRQDVCGRRPCYRRRDASPDGKTALGVAQDGSAVVGWDTRTPHRTLRFRLRAPGGSRFLAAGFSADGRRLVALARVRGRRGGLRYEVRLAGSVRTPAAVVDAGAAVLPAVSPDGRMLAERPSRAGAVAFVELATGRRRESSERHRKPLSGLAFSPSGRAVATAGEDGLVMLWDPRTGTRLEVFGAHTGRVRAPAFGDGGATLYTAGVDGAVVAWDVHGARRLGRPFGSPAAVDADAVPWLAVAPTGRFVATPAREGSVAITGARVLGRPVATLRGPERTRARAAAFSRDASLLAVGHAGGWVGLWRTRGWRLARTIDVPAVTGLAFAPGGRTLYVLGSRPGGGGVTAWDVETGRARARRLGGTVTAVAVSPAADLVAVTLNDPGGSAFGGYASVLDAGTLEERYRVNVDGGYGRASAVAFSLDGRLLATGGGTGEVRFWDAETGDERGRTALPGAGWLQSLGFSADGETVAVGSADGRVRLVDVDGRSPLGPSLAGSSVGGVHVAFAPGRDRLFAAGADGRAVSWDVGLERLEARACRVAGRTLTRDEWQRFMPARAYEPVCR